MTRINTNVSSLTAQKTLAKSNAQLNTALTRLSTGLKINTGKDDPAGLIASEALRSDITSSNRAITNTERANQMIATADSALGQVSSLLNDIRGLVTEAANEGAMSADQIAANQLQVDSSLEAINRISQTTSFQGKRLLDGSLDFTTAYTAGDTTVTDLQINQANLGTSNSLPVDVVIGTGNQATKATKTGTAGAGATASVGITLGGTGNSFTVTAPGPGTGYNDVQVRFVETSDVALDAPTASYDANAKVLTINVNDTASTATTAIQTAVQRDTDFTVSTPLGSYDPTLNSPTSLQSTGTISFADGSKIALTAVSGGSAGNVAIHFAEAAAGPTVPGATLVAGQLNVTVNNAGTTTAADIAAAITAEGTYTAQVIAGDGATQGYVQGTDTALGIAATAAVTTHALAGGSMTFTAKTAGTAANTYHVAVISDLAAAAAPTANTTEVANQLTIHVARVGTTTLGAIKGVVDALDPASGTLTISAGADVFNAGSATVFTSDAADLASGETMTFTAKDGGTAANAYEINITADLADGGVGTPTTPTAFWDPTGGVGGTGALEIHIDGTQSTTLGAIKAVVNAYGLSPFTMTSSDDTGLIAPGEAASIVLDSTPAGAEVYTAGVAGDADFNVTPTTLGTAAIAAVDTSTTGGVDGVNTTTGTGGTDTGGLLADLVFQLTGNSGTQVFKFQAGATATMIANAVELVKDATGVSAAATGSNLTFTSSEYGSEAAVAIDVVSEGTGGGFKTAFAGRYNGTDVVAQINGMTATGKGNTLSLNSASLSMSMTVSDGSFAPVSFTINGGGAQFQLGPDVVTNQQARIGVQSVNSYTLRGQTGRLYEIGSGETKSLTADAGSAAKIVDEVITKVTSLRGRLGAFQKTTLESNINSLKDTVENLTAAESSIRDADFAAESANLTRAQILVQSGTSVLGIANSNPQNVLALLRG